MSALSNLIFNNESHYISSTFGMRNGKMHNAVDYATYSKKIPQFAIAEGEITSYGKADDNALFVWVSYPDLGVRMLHYHLDSISQSLYRGAQVTKGTLLGYTGSTGNSTGIHLHLGVKPGSSDVWIDPEKWSKETLEPLLKIRDKSNERKASTKAEPEFIWSFLIQRIKNPYGVAGLMGNLYHESSLIPNNLEGKYNKVLNLTNAEYTYGVDNNTYKNFVSDGAGYGLAQWTVKSRKEKFYKYWKTKGGSIGNIETQLEFLYLELVEDFSKEVLPTLKTATSVLEASNTVLKEYENPEVQSDTVKTNRANKGMEYYNSYAHITAEVVTQNYPSIEAQDEEETWELVIRWAVIGEIEN